MTAFDLLHPGLQRAWIGKVPAFAELKDGRAEAIISFLLRQSFLGEDGGRLHLGIESERQLGRRNFSELLSIITTQPLFQVRYGRLEIGFVHPLSFAGDKDSPAILALGGRGWRLLNVDWGRRIAHVEPAQESGRSRWMGSSAPLSLALCASIRDLLQSTERHPEWSRRAADRLAELRDDLSQYCGNGSALVRKELSLEWWTFAGLAINQTIVQYLKPYIHSPLRADNLWIKLPPETSIERLDKIIQELQPILDVRPDWELQEPATDLLKFGNLLPAPLLRDLILARIADIPHACEILRSPIRILYARHCLPF